ncbi:MAG: hypothetical protein QM756_19675 [Polyangiaceae bacterium]
MLSSSKIGLIGLVLACSACSGNTDTPGIGGNNNGSGSNGSNGGGNDTSTFCVVGAQGCPCDSTGACGSGLSCQGNTCCSSSSCSKSTTPTNWGTGGSTGASSGLGGASGLGGTPGMMMPGDPMGMMGMMGTGGTTTETGTGTRTGSVCTPGVVGAIITDCGYPYQSANPRTSIVFNESEVLHAIVPSGGAPLASVKLFYNDEHALTMGVRQVVVNGASTNYSVSPLTSNPGSVRSPQTGTNATTGDQSGLDPSGRPMWPALFVTDTTDNPDNRAGDWQQGGTPWNPNAVYGTWKPAVRTVDPSSGASITPDADPDKNDWNGIPDAVPSSATATKSEGYSAEVRWDLVLVAGRSYRIQVMVHDGDQNKIGGDTGEACVNFRADSSCPQGSIACGPDSPCPIETESVCVSGCCIK